MLARGYSLTELMVALSAGAILVTACANLTGRFIVRSTQLDREQTVVEEGLLLQGRIEQQLQRAGYMAISLGNRLQGTQNPFINAWDVGAFPGEPDKSCVLFSYDTNHNSLLDESEPNERFGVRLRDGALESRVAGLTCQQSGWQDLTSPDISVTQFSLATPLSTPALIHIRFTLRHRQQNALSASRDFAMMLPNYAN